MGIRQQNKKARRTRSSPGPLTSKLLEALKELEDYNKGKGHLYEMTEENGKMVWYKIWKDGRKERDNSINLAID